MRDAIDTPSSAATESAEARAERMFHVEHSDVELEPAVAEDFFGDRLPLARAFTARLAQQGEQLGLIGPLERPRIWSRHVLNSAVVAPLLRPGRVGDIGSGAGLPGLVLAIARPDVRFVLIEAMERRAEWLRSEADRLSLVNVDVIHARAEDSGMDGRLDQVTARAVSSLQKLVPLSAPLLRRGGEMIFLKGSRVAAEVEAADRQLRRARARDVEILELGGDLIPEATWVFRATVD